MIRDRHLHSSRARPRFPETVRSAAERLAKHFGAVEEDVAAGLILRHDSDSNYFADDFQDEIEFLGIESFPAFVRQPEGSGVAERVIKTLKECPASALLRHIG